MVEQASALDAVSFFALFPEQIESFNRKIVNSSPSSSCFCGRELRSGLPERLPR
jgi:hypothetical protein